MKVQVGDEVHIKSWYGEPSAKAIVLQTDGVARCRQCRDRGAVYVSTEGASMLHVHLDNLEPKAPVRRLRR